MRIVVTGGTGFLGWHLIPRLVNIGSADGHEVFCPSSREWDLVRSTPETLSAYFNFKVIRPDAVIHAAAYYGGLGINQKEPVNLFFKNCTMALNLFEAARLAGVKTVIPVGSACAYPGSLSGDLKEEDFWSGRCHDSVEAYGFSKKLQVVAQRVYEKGEGIRGPHLIVTNLLGENDIFDEYRSHVPAALVKKFCDAVARGEKEVTCWGTGEEVREFLYAGDAADALVWSLDHLDAGVVNIGTGIGTSIKELAELIAQASGFEGVIWWDSTKPKGISRKVLDVSKAAGLGWKARTPLVEAVQRTVDWYRRTWLPQKG